MTAVAHHGATAVIGDYLQPVLGQVEGADNLRPQQAADVGAIRVCEILVQLPADRSTTDVGVALENEHIETGTRQVARGHQPVVAGPNDDDVMPCASYHAFYGSIQLTLE